MSDNAGTTAATEQTNTAAEVTQNETTTGTQAAPSAAPAPAAQNAAPPQEPQQSETQQTDANSSDMTGLFDESEEQKDSQTNEEVIPENYTFSSGTDQPVPDEDVKAYSAIAKELGLTQEKAQRLYEMGSSQLRGNLENYSRAWAEQTARDPELGGDNLKQTKANISRFLNEYATPEFRQLMKVTRLANNPEVLRVLSRAGARLSQDNVYINGNNHVSAKRDPYAYMTNSPELS